LETNYSSSDYTDVSTKNDVYVRQSAVGEYAIHQFKDYIDGNSYSVEIEARSNCNADLSTIYLQVYNINTSSWETIDSNNTVEAGAEFTMTASKDGIGDYKDDNNIVSFRIYQEAK